MQEIADRASINKALLHYYFRTKEQLFERIFMEVASRIVPAIRQLLEGDIVLEEKIRGFLRHYIGVMNENPFLPLFVVNEFNRQPQVTLNKILRGNLPDIEIWNRQVKSEIRKGKIRKIDPEVLLIQLFSAAVFPFIGKPIFCKIMNKSEKQYQELLKGQSEQVAEFILQSLKH
jgi:AcrR family transcriptional regulator